MKEASGIWAVSKKKDTGLLSLVQMFVPEADENAKDLIIYFSFARAVLIAGFVLSCLFFYAFHFDKTIDLNFFKISFPFYYDRLSYFVIRFCAIHAVLITLVFLPFYLIKFFKNIDLKNFNVYRWNKNPDYQNLDSAIMKKNIKNMKWVFPVMIYVLCGAGWGINYFIILFNVSQSQAAVYVGMLIIPAIMTCIAYMAFFTSVLFFKFTIFSKEANK